MGVYVFFNYDTTVTQVETIWGTGYLFATAEEQQDVIIGKIVLVLIFVITGGFLLRKYDKDKKKGSKNRLQN